MFFNRIHDIQTLLVRVLSTSVAAQKAPGGTVYHVAENDNDANGGMADHSFKTIMAQANAATPGAVILVHAGIYREQIIPPGGGNSDGERITYRAAKADRGGIKRSEMIKNWKWPRHTT